MEKLKLTWAEFSTLGAGMLVYAMQFHSKQEQPNLKLKTWPKLLLGSLPLAFTIHSLSKPVQLWKAKAKS
jgi:hypothetical protein